MAKAATSQMSAISRALPWVSGLVLIAGIVAFLIVKLASGDSSPKTQPAAKAPQAPTKASGAAKPAAGTSSRTGKPVRFDAAARQVASKFILTAVARKHLDQAWPLAGPALRVDTTYKEWLTGNISVIPFLDRIDAAKFKVDRVADSTAQVEVSLIPHSAKLRAQFFIMRLIKVGAGAKRHWVVNYWIPRGGIAVPVDSGGTG